MFSSFDFELDLFGDRHSVLRHHGEPQLFSMTTLRPFGPRVTDRVGQVVDAAKDAARALRL